MLDDAPLIQELLAERSHEILAIILKARFGSVTPDIMTALRPIIDEEELLRLVKWSAQCTDLDAFRARLSP